LFITGYSPQGVSSYRTEIRVANVLVGDVRGISFWVGDPTVSVDDFSIFLAVIMYVGPINNGTEVVFCNA
jgi:hypothetical protein